jgi:hypothetical protein
MAQTIANAPISHCILFFIDRSSGILFLAQKVGVLYMCEFDYIHLLISARQRSQHPVAKNDCHGQYHFVLEADNCSNDSKRPFQSQRDSHREPLLRLPIPLFGRQHHILKRILLCRLWHPASQ